MVNDLGRLQEGKHAEPSPCGTVLSIRKYDKVAPKIVMSWFCAVAKERCRPPPRSSDSPRSRVCCGSGSRFLDLSGAPRAKRRCVRRDSETNNRDGDEGEKGKRQVTKKASVCGHGIAIHHAKAVMRGKQWCWHPGCKCRNYNTVTQSASTARHGTSRAV
jgi:hypothetical protein